MNLIATLLLLAYIVIVTQKRGLQSALSLASVQVQQIVRPQFGANGKEGSVLYLLLVIAGTTN
jgi:hypothetical protein